MRGMIITVLHCRERGRREGARERGGRRKGGKCSSRDERGQNKIGMGEVEGRTARGGGQRDEMRCKTKKKREKKGKK